MHTLLIVFIVLLAILIVILGIIAFVLVSAFTAVQPIIAQLGKISMVLEGARLVGRRIQKWRKKRRKGYPMDED